jgi:hypothetical protein
LQNLGRIAPRERETASVSRHCEERSDEAIHTFFAATWIASLTLAMTASELAALKSNQSDATNMSTIK